jgi:hypothetical protein
MAVLRPVAGSSGQTANWNIEVGENNEKLVANAWARVCLRDGNKKAKVVVIYPRYVVCLFSNGVTNSHNMG